MYKPAVNFFEQYLISVQLCNPSISAILESAKADAKQNDDYKTEEAFLKCR